MDVHDKLDELTAVLESARAMPMSASCIVNRAEVLALLEDLRELLPEEFHHAELLLDDREAVVEEGRREARRLVEEAHAHRAALVSETEVLAEAVRQAEELQLASTEEALSMRREVEDYVDGKLANFEIVLNKTLATVHRGRERLLGRHDLDALDGEPAPHLPG